MVVAGEIDHDPLHATQLRRSQSPVVPVEGHTGSERETQPDSDRGKHPSSRTEVGVSLADVMDQGRPDQINPVGTCRDHMKGRGETVALVGRSLGEKSLLEVPLRQPPSDGIPLSPVETLGSGDVVEAGCQVGPAAGHFSAVAGLAVDAQGRLGSGFEPGRRYLPAAASAHTVGALSDALEGVLDLV